MKTRDKIYVIVPSTLLVVTLIILALNNYIIEYLPPNVLAVYPLWPCWPSNGIYIGGPDFIKDMHFLNEKRSYRIGEDINPRLVYTTSDGIFAPNMYIKNSLNQTVWHYDMHTLKKGCGLTLHYNLQDLTEPPRLNQTGQYEMVANSFADSTAFQFYVTP